MWHDVLALGQQSGLHRIERLMREQALRARPRRRGLPQDRGQRSAIADNVLDRQFRADAPNQKWVADFTYIWTAEGWWYAAAVLDLYSRRIVGWSMQDSMTSQLVADALMMAVWRRGKPVALLHRSDQGSQGVFNRSSQHWVVERILGTRSRSPLVSSSPAFCAACCSMSGPRLGSLARSREQARADVFDYIEALQLDTSSFDTRLRQSDRVRESSKSLGRCPPNRQQPTLHEMGYARRQKY